MADQFKTQDYYNMLTHVVHELPHSKPGELFSERYRQPEFICIYRHLCIVLALS